MAKINQKGVMERFLNYVGYKKNTSKKNFEGAIQNRLSSGWGTTNTAIDKEIYSSLSQLRSRARDLSINNDYVKKYLNLMSNNIVGPNGFNLQVQAADFKGVVDTVGNQLVEDYFTQWSHKEFCEVTGKYGFNDLCRLIIKTVARDGECLVRKIRDKKQNKFGFTLQILDIDRLDHMYNVELQGGNVIKMGIEMNQYGKPVAYHIRKFKNNDTMGNATYNQGDFERIKADDIIHLFISDRPEQSRGFTWLHTAMISLKMLDSYQEAALVAARVGASKMGFFVSNNSSNDATQIADSEDEKGNLIMEADPGVFSTLPEGYDFKTFDPGYPTGEYANFIKSVLRSISSGLNVSYNSLASDLEGVNYSSIRAGLLEERDMYMNIQNWFIENFLKDIYIEWLNTSMLNNALKFYNGSVLPIEKLDKFSIYSWKGRRFAWVDPLKDIQAHIQAIDYGLKSRTDVINEMGNDIEDVFMSLSKEQDMAVKYNLNLSKDDNIYKNTVDINNNDNEQNK